MLCDSCSQLDVLDITAGLSSCKVLEFVHHQSWNSVCGAVVQGCELCALLKQAIHEACEECFEWSADQTSEHHYARDREENSAFILSTHESGRGLRYDRKFDSRTRESFTEHERSVDERFPDGLAFRPFVRVCLEDGENLNIHNRKISRTVNFKMCKDWIIDCSVNHAKCSALEDKELPTRLIDVGASNGSEEPKLVETRGRKGRYITLSHCWGNSNPPVTNAGSFANYLTCIPFNTLSKTFQDAIRSVQKLGYRYLWIDCFCIIQGDQADWEIECSRMHTTFANSAFTIAGPGAWNTEAGFLHSRPQPAVPPLTLQVTDRNGIVKCCITIELADPGACSSNGLPRVQQSSALSTRAWIVQERYLSPRTLYFGTSQAYLECQSTHLFEISREPQRLVLDTDLWFRKHINFTADPKQTLQTWYHIVEVYSKRNLSKESDRLPALSGLASRMATVINSTYLAGIWKDDLLQGLHWHMPYDLRDAENLSKEPATNKAPSWSWASCDYPTRWVLKGVDCTDWNARVLDGSTIVSGLDPFGEVAQGRLVLQGKLRQAPIFQRPIVLPDDFWVRHSEKAITGWYIMESQRSSIEIAGFAPDRRSGQYEQRCSDLDKHIWCLLLGHHTIAPPSEEDTIYISVARNFWTALALEMVPGESKTFRRLGLITSTDFGQDKVLSEFRSNTNASDHRQAIGNFFDEAVETQAVII